MFSHWSISSKVLVVWSDVMVVELGVLVELPMGEGCLLLVLETLFLLLSCLTLP